MASDDTRNGLLCSRLLRTSCALVVMLCLLIAAAPTPTRPDYDGAYPRYSKQEIRRAIAWSARSITLTPPCCALSSKPNLIFASMPCLPKERSA